MDVNIEYETTKVFKKNRKALEEKLPDGTNKYRYIINSGSSRSSKSYSLLQILIYRALQSKEQIVIAMKTLAQMKDTMLKSDIPEILEPLLKHIDINHNKADQVFYFPNGSTISFIPCDDPARVKGIKSSLLFIDEANEVTRDALRQLIMRCSGTVFLAFNPNGDLSEIDKYIERENAIHIHSTYKDNPFLPAEQIEEIENLKYVDLNYYRIYALGLRGVEHDSVYQHFEGVDEMPMNIFYNYYYGMDFSFHRNPLMRIWTTPKSNQIFIEEIFFGQDVGVADVINLLKEHNIEKDIPIIADSANPMVINDIKKAGYYIIPTNKNKYSVFEGINYIKSLRVQYDQTTADRLPIELSNYKWKKIQGRIMDIPNPVYDDCMDAIRYAVMYAKDLGVINQSNRNQTKKFFGY